MMKKDSSYYLGVATVFGLSLLECCWIMAKLFDRTDTAWLKVLAPIWIPALFYALVYLFSSLLVWLTAILLPEEGGQ